jgi:hypothetical protein
MSAGSPEGTKGQRDRGTAWRVIGWNGRPPPPGGSTESPLGPHCERAIANRESATGGTGRTKGPWAPAAGRTGGLADADAPSPAALAVDDSATAGGAHPGAKAALALAFDLADAMRIVHRYLTIQKSRPKTAGPSHYHNSSASVSGRKRRPSRRVRLRTYDRASVKKMVGGTRSFRPRLPGAEARTNPAP